MWAASPLYSPSISIVPPPSLVRSHKLQSKTNYLGRPRWSNAPSGLGRFARTLSQALPRGSLHENGRVQAGTNIGTTILASLPGRAARRSHFSPISDRDKLKHALCSPCVCSALVPELCACLCAFLLPSVHSACPLSALCAHNGYAVRLYVHVYIHMYV